MNRLPQLLKINSRQELELNSPQADSKEKRNPSFYNADRVSAVVENRQDGKNLGVTIFLEGERRVTAWDSFDDVSTRLTERLVLNEVTPTNRESFRVSINPTFITQIEATTRDQQGAPDGSRVELRGGHQYYVRESPTQIFELYAAIDQRLQQRRSDAY